MQGDAPQVGQVVGPYEILRELGRGGMGVVYKAHETSLNRMVALKILPPHLAADPVFTERFAREARSAASLIHPNVVTIHAIGAESGKHFIAMEYVKGRTLSELVRQSGSLSPDRALGIVLQTCDALRAAHKRGLVHRDIKPQNIMMDDAGRVKVMDFGLAKATTSESNLTAAGAMIGTPLYMSPEQCEGQPADPRSDIYSLGVVLFEMLTGRVPFEASTPLAIMRQIVEQPFPDVRRLCPTVSDDVAAILGRMTARNVKRRYQSVEEVHRDIENVLSRAGKQSTLNAQTVQVKAVQTFTPGKQIEQVDAALRATGTPPHPPAARSPLWVGIGTAVLTAVVMLAGFFLLGDKGSSGGGGVGQSATVIVPPPAPAVEPAEEVAESNDPILRNRVDREMEELERLKRETELLAQRAAEARMAEEERRRLDAEADRRAREQAALDAAAEAAERKAELEEAARATAELERQKAETKRAMAQLRAEQEARDREAARLKAAEDEARRAAAELQRRERELEDSRIAAREAEEQRVAAEAARRAAEEQAAREAAARAEAERLAKLEEESKPKFPDIAGRWTVSGSAPTAEGKGSSVSPTANVSVDGTTARIKIDRKELAGQYVNGRLTAAYETTISATGRSGKGKSQVAQVWEVSLAAVSANRMEGSFSVNHSGFQASEAGKNGTRTESIVLTR